MHAEHSIKEANTKLQEDAEKKLKRKISQDWVKMVYLTSLRFNIALRSTLDRE